MAGRSRPAGGVSGVARVRVRIVRAFRAPGRVNVATATGRALLSTSMPVAEIRPYCDMLGYEIVNPAQLAEWEAEPCA